MNQKSELEKLVEEIHSATAKELLRRIRNGEASPADLNVARQFLKDNGVDLGTINNTPVRELAEELPFGNDPKVVSM